MVADAYFSKKKVVDKSIFFTEMPNNIVVLTNCQARSENKLNFHFNAALTAVNLAKIEWLNTIILNDEPFSMANSKMMYNNELLLKIFIQWFGINPNLKKNRIIISELRSWGTIAA